MIKIQNLTRRYRKFVALDNLTLDIPEGSIFGFIGHNGAGKTTAIRILCGLLKASSGTASIGGLEVKPRNQMEIKKRIGYLPDYFGTYERMSVWEFLDFFAAAFRIPTSKRRKVIEVALEKTKATHMIDYAVNSLSHGMRQKIGLAKTILHDPDLLILDEPAGGLDPQARIEMKELILDLNREGKTILLSSHNLHELAAVANRVGILKNGKLVAEGAIDQIMRSLHQEIRIDLFSTDPADRVESALRDSPFVSDIQSLPDRFRVTFSGREEEIPDLLAFAIQKGLRITWFQEVVADLEKIYLEVTQNESSPAQ